MECVLHASLFVLFVWVYLVTTALWEEFFFVIYILKNDFFL